MTKRHALQLWLAAVLSSAGLGAQSARVTPPADISVAPVATQTAPSPPTVVRMTGTIEKYEPETRMLTIQTAKGSLRLALASLARIRVDGKLVGASELEALAGCRSIVRYTQSVTTKTIESVSVIKKK